jgi:hypothetical protein
MTTRTFVAPSSLILAAAVLAAQMTAAAAAGPVVKPGPTATYKDYSHKKYHPPRGCLGDPTCNPGTYSKGGGGWPDTGLNCTYSVHGPCSPQ